MSRKGLSILLIIIMAALAACRRGADNPALPTPVAGLPTSAATAAPAATGTGVFATATAEPPQLTSTPTPSLTPSPTAIPPTSTVPTMTPNSPTPIMPTAVPPTPTPNTGPPPGGSARIVFAPGATAATVQSNLIAGGDTDTWVLRVAAGQVVTVQTISTAPGTIVVKLGDMSGGVLATNLDSVGISAAVPATGDYQINFSTASGAPAVGYTAQVFIPAAGSPAPPTRIQFAPGASVTQLNDTLAAGGDLNPYVLSMGAGQTLSVAVFASPPAVTSIYIRNSAGQLVSSGTDMSGLSATTTAAGDYFIDVSSSTGAPAVSYRLTVNAPPVPSGTPQRIEFGPGQTSTTVNGLVGAGVSARYVLRIQAGQILMLNLAGQPVNSVDLTVTDAAGAVLNTARDPLHGLETAIPATGDYTINLSTGSATNVTYVMDVIVPPSPSAGATRVQFPPGATSATVTGALAFGGDLDNWVLRAAAGQTMSIGLATSQGGWIYMFVYNQAGQLIASGADTDGKIDPMGADGVVFQVPVTGDYTIVVSSIQAAPPLNYSLAIDLPPAGGPVPVRIEFGLGQTSTELNGQVVAGGIAAQYVIRVAAGQTLITDLNDNPLGNVDITVADASGATLNFGRAPTELGTRVSATGDYTITLSTMSATPVAYTLIVNVPPLPDAAGATRIIFGAGSTTATVSGDLSAGGAIDNWVIGAQTGQTLSLFLGASQPGWLMIYVYNAAGDIIALGSDLDVIAAPIATTGDYRIVIAADPAAGPITYSMVVEIP